jgi:hypothetical protein
LIVPEETGRYLNHFALYSFNDAYWQTSSDERASFHKEWLKGLREAALAVDVYQVFAAEDRSDILVWSAIPAEENCATATFFERYARASLPFRHLIQPSKVLWDYTRPSQYTKTRSTQEIDPLCHDAQTLPRHLSVHKNG